MIGRVALRLTYLIVSRQDLPHGRGGDAMAEPDQLFRPPIGLQCPRRVRSDDSALLAAAIKKLVMRDLGKGSG